MNLKNNHNRKLNDFSNELNIIKSAGFNPIGVSQMYLEDVFIFNTQEESKKAYELLEIKNKSVIGWWYGKYDFEKEKEKYEKEYNGFIVNVIWF